MLLTMSIALVKIMTTKAIYYYSLSGKTAALAESVNNAEVKLLKLNSMNSKDFQFGNEETIIIGSPTYGRGVPPMYFKQIIGELRNLSDRKIGIFGSGNTIYGEDLFCGATDVLEELLRDKNEIVFKYKFEGYPTEKNISEFNQLINTI